MKKYMIGNQKRKDENIDYAVLKKDWLTVNGAVGIAGLMVFLFMLLQRMGWIPNMPCMVHEVFHIYCLGCGGTRSIFALLQGKILTSLYCNPAIVLGVLLALHYELGVIITLKKRDGKRYYCNTPTLLVVYVIIVGIFSIIRNYLLVSCGIDMLEDFYRL